MELSLKRLMFNDTSTIGRLRNEDKIICWTLEDKVREIEGEPVETWKVPGQTAVPYGQYKVTITPSERFGRDMPYLNDVPGFTGIRIHPGNTDKDTEGCILVGAGVDNDGLVNSRLAFGWVLDLLQSAKDDVWLTIQ